VKGRTRTLVYLVAGIPLGVAGATVLFTGWLVVGLLAITPLVVPALVGFRAAAGGVAWLEARLANCLLGTSLEPPTLRVPGGGFWRRAEGVMRDGAFWRQQAYLLQGCILRSALGLCELVLFAAGVGAVLVPLTYRWNAPELGSWHADSFGRAILFLPAGLALLALAINLLGPLGSLSRLLASSLLRGNAPARSDEASRAARRRGLTAVASVAAFVGGVVVIVWAAAGGSTFWPKWVLLAFGLVVAMHGCVVAALDYAEPIRERRLTIALAIDAGIAAALSVFLIGVWAAAGFGYFWPGWAILGFAIVLGGHYIFDRWAGGAQRIAQLESSRAGAVDAQDAELRRIERDLHDGAQARLVALGMSLGMAEQKLVSDPEAAQELLAEARRGAQEALEELRDLARGIHPPVLADRGLEAAISALVYRSPLDVHVLAKLPRRPAPAVETAAYFVVAESLANAAKHAAAEGVEISLREDGDALVVAVADDGVGGADASGSGLQGLRQRVEALDGKLTIVSPAGGPTRVEAVIPCGW
jgi:signal transduction histidine kinase